MDGLGFGCLLISTPSLGVYYFFVVDSVCLSIRLSVCHKYWFFFFCFSMELSHFLAISSPWQKLQNVVQQDSKILDPVAGAPLVTDHRSLLACMNQNCLRTITGTVRSVLQQHKWVMYLFYRCSKCPAEFTRQKSYLLHQRNVHHCDRNFQCETCGRAFLFETNLIRHQQVWYLLTCLSVVSLPNVLIFIAESRDVTG